MQIVSGKITANQNIALNKRTVPKQNRLGKHGSLKFPLLTAVCRFQALPEYQIAHERAVFKAAAVVSDTKRVLKNLDGQGLAELRALQKPDNEIEDLLAAIIIIGTYGL